jgi:hypothetical protein
MAFEFPTVPVPSTGPTVTVLDPAQAPTTILDADQPFSLRIDWTVGGGWLPARLAEPANCRLVSGPQSSSLGATARCNANGASRTRTGDLLGAIQALSQLSYSPARVTL